MAISFDWVIEQMDRQPTDGFVVTVHYRVIAQDGLFYADNYGVLNYNEQPGESFIPYEDLTQEIVVGWVQDSLGKDAVETGLTNRIDALKHPDKIPGMPW